MKLKRIDFERMKVQPCQWHLYSSFMSQTCSEKDEKNRKIERLEIILYFPFTLEKLEFSEEKYCQPDMWCLNSLD